MIRTKWPSAPCSPLAGITAGSYRGQFHLREVVAEPEVFLRPSPLATRVQAAFRSAYGLPRVDAVAVSTDNVDHLRELTGALAYQIDDQVVREYRQLLWARRQPV